MRKICSEQWVLWGKLWVWGLGSTRVGGGDGEGEIMHLFSLTWPPQSAAAFGGGCRESQISASGPLLSQPAPWSVWWSVAPEPSRTKVYSQAAGGLPAHGNKSELILSCSMQVLLSTADPWATAHLGHSGEGGAGPNCIHHPCPSQCTRELAAALAGFASWPGQSTERPLVTQPYLCLCHGLTLWFWARPLAFSMPNLPSAGGKLLRQ